MSNKIRKTLLRVLYIYTLAGAGTFGVIMLIFPKFILNLFPFLESSYIPFGTLACLWTSFGLVSIFGIWKPLKFSTILLIQLSYKTLWFIFVIFPLIITKIFDKRLVLFIIAYALYIIGDILLIPFKEIFKSK